MAYPERLEIYKKIEAERQRPLITYITSLRPGASGQLGPDAIPEFVRQVRSIPKSVEGVDVLVISNGGDGIVPWRIVGLLRERFKSVGVLLPYVAYSAATLLALGADEVVMHPHSNLGPVDPQLTVPAHGAPGQMVQFGAEDIRHFLEFVRDDVGITDQKQLEQAFELLVKDVGSIPIGLAKRSTQLASSLGQQLLRLHMSDDSKAKAISEALNRSFYHHSFTLGPTQAKNIGLPIIMPSDELENLLWGVWEDIEVEMECAKPFNPLQVVLNDPNASSLLGPVPMVQLPSNLPPQLAQQAINNVLQQIGVVSVPPVDYEVLIAVMESVRCRSEFRTKGKITATRLPDMNIAMNILKTSEYWEFLGKT